MALYDSIFIQAILSLYAVLSDIAAAQRHLELTVPVNTITPDLSTPTYSMASKDADINARCLGSYLCCGL